MNELEIVTEQLQKTYQEMKEQQWGAFNPDIKEEDYLNFNEWLEYELWNGKRYFITSNFDGFIEDDTQMEQWLYELELVYIGVK